MFNRVLYDRLEQIAHDIEAKLPVGYSAVALANRGGEILIYRPVWYGKRVIAELFPDDDSKSLEVSFDDPIEKIIQIISEIKL